MVPVCPGIKRDGARCTVVVDGPQGYCYQHDPARADERKRAASRAGRSKPSRELAGIKRQLQDLADGVLAGEVERANASVCGQLLNVKLRALEVERKIKETEELEERIEQLEQTQNQNKGGYGWPR
jgi:hypothetical protein